MPDIPAAIALPVAVALCTVIGILWHRLIAKEDKHAADYLDLIERYHKVLGKLVGNVDLEEAGGDG